MNHTKNEFTALRYNQVCVCVERETERGRETEGVVDRNAIAKDVKIAVRHRYMQGSNTVTVNYV